MNVALSKYSQTTYEDTNKVISSPESADGASRCGSPDGPITDLFGLEVVHASRLARLC
ncbi:MAG: hypothetical protein IPK54_10420 [Dokdonella sp.]|uniref:hypothetical protein n=1 Tax=Dokdonella sp. TaxID=2291710 RepID=UPI0025BD5E33|nr:hypothetical protein [Dokdonella sp.]MBK8123946.1 hypothetical protein [Dokdonella sp.]